MPEFFSAMPKPQGGKWVACVIRSYCIPENQKEVWHSRPVTGLRRAYILARLVALWFDLNTPRGGRWDSVGVHWGVRKP
jgi:hypothetical protein